jgi:hypothetical protein
LKLLGIPSKTVLCETYAAAMTWWNKPDLLERAPRRRSEGRAPRFWRTSEAERGSLRAVRLFFSVKLRHINSES